MNDENSNRQRVYLGPLAFKLIEDHGDGTTSKAALELAIETLQMQLAEAKTNSGKSQVPGNSDPAISNADYKAIHEDIAELRRVQWMNLRVVSRELALTRQLMLATISEHAGEEMRDVIEIVENTVAKFHNDLDTPVLQKADKASVQWMEEIRRQQEIDRGQEFEPTVDPEAKDKEPDRDI